MKWPRNDSRPQYYRHPIRTDQYPLPPGWERGRGRTQPNSRSDGVTLGAWRTRDSPLCLSPSLPSPSTNPSSPSLNPSHPPSASPLSAPPCNLSFPGSSFTRESPPRHPSVATTPASPTLPIAFSFHPYEASNQHERR